MICLNLGCGDKKQPGEIGVDIIPGKLVDVVVDLNSPLPFLTGSVDYIYSNHSLEHLSNTIEIMEEIHRVLKPDGIVEIFVPHARNIEFFRDPTHKRAFTYGTFDYFVKDSKPVIYTDIEFAYITRELIFSKSINGKLGKFLYKISPRRYEKYYSWRYPCSELHVKLKVLKEMK